MNHSTLIAEIAKDTELSQVKVMVVMTALAEVIQETVARGEDVTLQGVAKFSATVRPERQGRNPATGEPMTVKAKRVPVIKALKPLKDAVAQ